MKKYYRVYSMCCKSVHPIMEIDELEALSYIIGAVNDYYDYIDIPDDEIGAFFDKQYDKALLFFDQNEFFECGDYCIYYQDEMPTRWNVYGNSTSII